MNRSGSLALLLCLLLATVAGAQSPPASPLALADLERMALERNPTLQQAAAEVEAAGGRAKQAGLFPNPQIGYVAEEFPYRGGEGRGKQGFFVQQTIPLGGKLGLGREAFRKEVDEAQANLEAQRLRVVNSVRSLYYEALIAARRVEVRERLARISEEAVDVSRQLVNTGAADRPDVLEAEIESREAGLALVAARNEQFHTWLGLGVMIGDPSLAPQPLSGGEDLAVAELERETAVQNLLRDSPQIRAAQARIAESEAAAKRAGRETFPDLFLRAGSDYDRELLPESGRPVGWEGFVEAGISIPLFNGNAGGRRAAAAQVSRARAELRRTQLALQGQLSGVFEVYLTSLRAADEYRTQILPRAEQAYRLYLDKFQEMAAAYPQVLIAQRTLFQTTERYLRALEEAHRAAVQIQGFLLVDGLEAPPSPGRADGIRTGELPGAVRSGELPLAVRLPGNN
jgi:cobalt-zinc-cadmium efflux system outer membrane protein